MAESEPHKKSIDKAIQFAEEPYRAMQQNALNAERFPANMFNKSGETGLAETLDALAYYAGLEARAIYQRPKDFHRATDWTTNWEPVLNPHLGHLARNKIIKFEDAMPPDYGHVVFAALKFVEALRGQVQRIPGQMTKITSNDFQDIPDQLDSPPGTTLRYGEEHQVVRAKVTDIYVMSGASNVRKTSVQNLTPTSSLTTHETKTNLGLSLIEVVFHSDDPKAVNTVELFVT